MDVWWFPTIFYIKIWNHPIETTIYKWLFGVPGPYYSSNCSETAGEFTPWHIFLLFCPPSAAFTSYGCLAFLVLLFKGRLPKHGKATSHVHPGRWAWNLQISHLERNMIWTKPPWNYVPAVNLQGCRCWGFPHPPGSQCVNNRYHGWSTYPHGAGTPMRNKALIFGLIKGTTILNNSLFFRPYLPWGYLNHGGPGWLTLTILTFKISTVFFHQYLGRTQCRWQGTLETIGFSGSKKPRKLRAPPPKKKSSSWSFRRYIYIYIYIVFSPFYPDWTFSEPF